MNFVGPMRRGERRPRFCLACDHDITCRPTTTQFCLRCAEKRQKVLSKLRMAKAPMREQAGWFVQKAIAMGILPALDGTIKCVDCGKPARHYDHRDYFRPIEVDPVCVSCNSRRGPAYPYTEFPPAWPTQEEVLAAMREHGLPELPVENKGKRVNDPRAKTA